MQVVRRAPGPIVVRVPDQPSVPERYRGMGLRVQKLLSGVDDNSKLSKSNAGERRHGFRTFGLSLAPASSSGKNLCVSSTAGCRISCLFHQGRARVWPAVNLARIGKAVAFNTERSWFKERLLWELDRTVEKTLALDLTPAFRLNVVSDVLWEKVLPEAFGRYAEGSVRFYDYTKHAKRMLAWCRDELPEEYHLTFSRSESNDGICREILGVGGNVAVVFGGALPELWEGRRVVPGDETDLRFLDPENVVVGLLAKGKAMSEESGFVVRSLGLGRLLKGKKYNHGKLAKGLA